MTELPPGWTWTTLGDVALSVRNGIFVSRPGADPDGVPILRISAVRPGQLDLTDIRYSGAEASALASADQLISPGDLLFTRYNGNIDYVGACAIVPDAAGDLTYPDKLIRVRIDASAADPTYVCYAFQAPAVRAEVRSSARTTAGQAGISGSNLKRIGFPLPPLAEQRRIVTAVDGELSRIDKGCALLSAVAQRVERFREYVMLLAATGRLDGRPAEATAAHPTPAGVADGDLPGLPSRWQWCRLGDIADVVGGVTKDSKRQSDPDLVEVPYLRVANVQRGFLDLSSVATIRVPANKAYALQLQPGDVLLNEGGDRDKLGRGWIWQGQIEPCIHQNHVFRARVRDNVLHPKLLAWHANSFGKAWFQANGRQSVNLASISLSKVKQFPVPLPPIEEQAQLVSTAEQYLSLLDKLEAAIVAAQVRAGKLRTSVLSTAFAGRLVAQDPNDEPASELLARIRAERASAPARKRTRSPRTPRQAPAPSHSATASKYQEEELPL